MMRSAKLRERIESAAVAAARAQQIALQKSDIAAYRTATARAKSEQADYAASTAQNDSQMAIIIAKQYGGGSLTTQGQGSIAPLRRRLSDFSQVRRLREGQMGNFDMNHVPQSPQPGNRQFLDPNEPFGGRRGSFRNQMLTPNGPQQIVYQQQQQFSNSTNFGGYPNQMGSNQPNRYMYHQQRTSSIQGSPKDPFSQAFSDHFDHYALMNQRGSTPATFASSSQYLSNSRIPSSSQLANMNSFNSSQLSMTPSLSPSPVPLQYPSSVTPTFSGNPSPSPIPSHSKPLGSKANHVRPTSSTSSQFSQIPPMKSRNRMMNTNPNTIDYSMEDNVLNETKKDSSVRHLRTASLYRPSIQQSSNSSGNTDGFKRKPSLQANVCKQVNKPVMSREEVSILSHQQREHRRQEQEYRERLSRNPLLYLWSPNLVAWFNRQKLVILVFIVNVCIAYLFIQMIV